MLRKLAVLSGILIAQICFAQAPAGAPAGSTGLCNDGTYYSGAVKSGACRGHKGLKTWFGASAATASKPSPGKADKTNAAKPQQTTASTTPAASPSPAPSKSASSSTTASSSPKAPAAPITEAPGARPGMVWLNSASNVYHCPGTRYYGKTKAGAYMSEADAKAKGGRPDGGKPCK